MTLLIGAVLILIGAASLGLYPPNRVGVPFLAAGVIVMVLRITGAVAADLPVYQPLPVSKVEMRALRCFIAKGRPQPLDRALQAPIGKGRIE